MEERNYKLYVHISPSNKRYYGITSRKKCEDRWQNGKGYQTQLVFNRAINKYGWANFQHIILFDNLTEQEANLLEKCYIALYDTTNPKYGYNQSLGGNIPNEEAKRKISEANKGRKLTEEHKRKVGEASKGRKHTEETKKKMSEAAKGRKLTEEAKKKLSEAHKGKPGLKGEKNPMYGKHLTEETKKKISEATKGENHHYYGKHFSEEHRRKISEANKGENNYMYGRTGENNPLYGKHLTEEHKRKLSEVHKGKHASEETKKKMSEAHKGENNHFYGKHHTEEAKRKVSEANKGKYNMNGKIKPILMFTKDEQFIRKFDSMADANEYLGKDRYNSNISQCARGKKPTAYGYKWIYEEDYIKEQEKQVI